MENGFFLVQHCPQIEFFCNEKKKSINVGELFSRSFGFTTDKCDRSKIKSICNFNKKKLIFLCNLEVFSLFQFQHSVRRVFRNGGWFGLFLNIYRQKQTCIVKNPFLYTTLYVNKILVFSLHHLRSRVSFSNLVFG